MEERLEIQYSPEPKDYIRASRTLAMKTRGFVLIGIVAILLIVASAVVLLVPSIGDKSIFDTSWRGIAVIIILASAFYFVYILAIIPMELSRNYKTNENLREVRRFTFANSGVTLQIGDRISILAWDKIQKAAKGSGLYLLIHVADQRTYPIIPERAFENEDQMAQFLDLLKEKNIPVK